MFDRTFFGDEEPFQCNLMANAVKIYEHVRLNPGCVFPDSTDYITARMLNKAGLLECMLPDEKWRVKESFDETLVE